MISFLFNNWPDQGLIQISKNILQIEKQSTAALFEKNCISQQYKSAKNNIIIINKITMLQCQDLIEPSELFDTASFASNEGNSKNFLQEISDDTIQNLMSDGFMNQDSDSTYNVLQKTQSYKSSGKSELTDIHPTQSQINLQDKRFSARIHLKQKRQKRGVKNQLQISVEGYWTKNFLQFGKKPHLEFIEKKLGKGYLNENQTLKRIQSKNGITLGDYTQLYLLPQLKETWKQFFHKRVLYRSLMLSRVESKYRLIFCCFICRFEDAFIKGQFTHIA